MLNDGVAAPQSAHPMVSLLGSVGIWQTERAFETLGALPSRILAALALTIDEPVTSSKLIEIVWDGAPPPTAASALRVHLTRLRRSIGDPQLIVGGHRGYTLSSSLITTDVMLVTTLHDLAARQKDPAESARLLRRAIACWRGSSLGELASLSFFQPTANRLDAWRRELEEQRASAMLEAGEHQQACAELLAMVEGEPFQEKRTELLMLALYRSGRQTEALAAYARLRSLLADDLGVDPGPQVQRLQVAILRHDPALDLLLNAAPSSEIRVGAASKPGTVLRRLITDRLAICSPAARAVLQAVVALGDHASLELIVAVTDLTMSHATAALQELADHGLVVAAQDGAWVSVPEVTPVIRESLFDRAFQKRVGEALAGGGVERQLAAAELLLGAVPLVERTHAIELTINAVDRELKSGRAEAVLDLISTALAAADEDREHPLRVRLLGQLARAHASVGNFELADQTWSAAVDLARDLGEPRTFAQIVLDHDWAHRSMFGGSDGEVLIEALTRVADSAPTLRVRLASALAGEVHVPERGVLLTVPFDLNKVLCEAEQLSDPGVAGEALRARHMLLRSGPDLAARREVARSMAAQSKGTNNPDLQASVEFADLVDLLTLGETATVDDRLRSLDELALASGDPRLRWHADLSRITVLRDRGEFERAAQLSHQTTLRAAAVGIVDADAAAMVNSFLALWQSGSVVRLRNALAQFVQVKPHSYLSWSAMALTFVETHDRDRASECADRAHQLLTQAPPDELRTLVLGLLVETERWLARRERLRWLTRELEPWSGLFVVFGQVTGSFGPVDRLLGVLGQAMSDRDANSLLRCGREQAERAGWSAWVRQCDRDLGAQ